MALDLGVAVRNLGSRKLSNNAQRTYKILKSIILQGLDTLNSAVALRMSGVAPKVGEEKDDHG